MSLSHWPYCLHEPALQQRYCVAFREGRWKIHSRKLQRDPGILGFLLFPGYRQDLHLACQCLTAKWWSPRYHPGGDLEAGFRFRDPDRLSQAPEIAIDEHESQRRLALQPLNHFPWASPGYPMTETSLTLESPFPSLIDISMMIWRIEESIHSTPQIQGNEMKDMIHTHIP